MDIRYDSIFQKNLALTWLPELVQPLVSDGAVTLYAKAETARERRTAKRILKEKG
jgi:hypothetical protein